MPSNSLAKPIHAGAESAKDILSHAMRKPTMFLPKRSDTNRPVQSQKMARDLKLWALKVNELYYPSSGKAKMSTIK